MQQHVNYWTELMKQGKMCIQGPYSIHLRHLRTGHSMRKDESSKSSKSTGWSLQFHEMLAINASELFYLVFNLQSIALSTKLSYIQRQSQVPVLYTGPDRTGGNRNFRMYHYEGSFPNRSERLLATVKSLPINVLSAYNVDEKHVFRCRS